MRRCFVAVLAGMLVLASCSGGDDVDDLEELVTSSTSSSTTTSSSTSSTSTTEPTDAEPSVEVDDAVTETWTSLLEAAASGAPSAEQVAVIESLASPETVEQLLAPLFPESPSREIEFFPALTAQDDGSYAIDDCLVMNRGISEGVSNWFVGAAESSEESPTGWIISEISVINLDPCVPRSIADAAIEGYEAYWDAFDQIFDPTDDDSELVEATTTSPYREFVEDLIDDLAGEGQRISGRPSTFPEFFEIGGTTDLVIIDCQLTNPDLGVYLQSTGERTDLISPVGPDQTDVREATMKLEGGVWKVADLQGIVDVECGVPEPLPNLQVAGGELYSS